jgi:hypothetical protein
MHEKLNTFANSKPKSKIFLGRLSGAQMGSFGQTTLNQKISGKVPLSKVYVMRRENKLYYI